MIQRLKRWAASIRLDLLALGLASRDPRVAWHAKAIAMLVAAYALSPIDLIPDFIPVLGLLDDLLIVPLGIVLARRLVPGEVLSELRARAASEPQRVSMIGAVLVVLAWLGLALVAYRLWSTG